MTDIQRGRGMLLLAVSIGMACAAPVLAAQPTTRYGEAQRAAPSAAADSLSLPDLEQMALGSNPTLIQAAAQASGAQGRSIQAGLYPNPVVGYTGEEIGAEGTAGQQGIFIDQVIVTGGKLRYSRSKYAHEVTQMNWQAMAQQYRVLNGVRVRFYRVLALERLVKVRSDLLKVADEAVVTTEELTNVGQANRSDLLQARVEARRQRLALTDAQNRYWGAWQDLAAFVGQPALPQTSLKGKLDETSDVLDWEGTLSHLREASPEVQAARAEVARNQCALAREQVEPIPNVNVRVGTQYNFETNQQQALAEVGLRLPIFDRNQGNIRAAQADLTRAQAEVTRVELSLQRRLADVFTRYRTALTTVQEYQKSILPESDEAYRLYLTSFRQRRAAWPQVLIAQRDYFQSSVEYVEALVELRRLEVAIRGLLLVDGLDEPPGPPGEGRVRDSSDRQVQEALGQPISARQGRGPDQRIN